MPQTAASRVSFSRDFNEREGDGIDAVALIRRSRTILEHMTEVGLTPAAKNFYSSHEETIILFGFYVLLRDGRPETRPACG